MYTVPSGVPSSRRKLTLTLPRREHRVTIAPAFTPRRANSRPLTEAVAIGSSASSTLDRRVMLPVCQCSSCLPVIKTMG